MLRDQNLFLAKETSYRLLGFLAAGSPRLPAKEI